jgi:dimethylglycine dehydrogenase
LLQRLTPRDVSAEAFRFLAVDRFDIGTVPAMVGRISFTGDLGYEIWVKSDYLATLFDLLMDAGGDLGIRPFGGRALNSLRLEKSFGTWFREFRPIYTPWEAGLDRFIAVQKPDFIGREATIRTREQEPRYKLVTMTVDAEDADAIGDEPILKGGEVAGWVTSGGYAHHAQKSVAMGYVKIEAFDPAASYEIEIIGEPRPARIQPEPLFDPKGERMRG